MSNFIYLSIIEEYLARNEPNDNKQRIVDS